ncbi:MAG: type II toxin-antitoxin system VapC family toxin [Proteobacteria bacterium]|nr:type II toxin-antitoxin system VapC family toxin [Pseudomonadota bacterium]
MVLLDTSAAIGFINRNSAHRTRFFETQNAGHELAISTVALFELWFGVANSKRWSENARALRSFLDQGIMVLPFDADDARAAGELRATLAAKGTLIGPYDLLIAARAIRRGATLVTANTREFAQVPGLVWEDWSME